MALHRIFDPELTLTLEPGMSYVGTGSEAHHAVRVKRVQSGEMVEILNGQGLRACGQIKEIDRQQGSVTIAIAAVEQHPLPTSSVIVASAVPKGQARVYGMVDQLSQLGVQRWIPMICHHSVVNPRAGRVLKWQRIAIESAKQCGRAHLMEIGQPSLFAEAVVSLMGCSEHVCIADVSGASALSLFSSTAKDDAGQPMNGALGVLIGPESGFAEEEWAFAAEADQIQNIRLGQHTMRIETAAVAAATILMQFVETQENV